MKELLLYVAKNLVDHPDAVTVTEVPGDVTVLELRVAPEDMGKVIGRQGRIAKEIRTIVKSVAQRAGQKVSVEIVDGSFVRRPTAGEQIRVETIPHRGQAFSPPGRDAFAPGKAAFVLVFFSISRYNGCTDSREVLQWNNFWKRGRSSPPTVSGGS